MKRPADVEALRLFARLHGGRELGVLLEQAANEIEELRTECFRLAKLACDQTALAADLYHRLEAR